MNKTLLIGNESKAVKEFITSRSYEVDHSFSTDVLHLLFELPRVSNVFIENTQTVRDFCEIANDITNINSVVISIELATSLPLNVRRNLAVFLTVFPEYTSIYVVANDSSYDVSALDFITRKFYVIDVSNSGTMHLFGKEEQLHKHEVVILGSCVARDSMEINNIVSPLKLNVIEYIGRNSIAAFGSKKVIYPKGSASLPSNFLTKCITYDLEKKTVEHVANSLARNRLLLLDFMDERFDLVEVKDSLITNSWDYRETTLCKKHVTPDKVHKFYSQFKIELWKDNFSKFVNEVSKTCLRKNIIIFLPAMTRVFYRENDIVTFDESRYKINEYNEMLQLFKAFLADAHPDIKIIEPLPWMMFCDYRHKWGGHPYHYNNYLYMYFSRQIKNHDQG